MSFDEVSVLRVPLQQVVATTSVFSSTIGLNIFEISYEVLLGLGIMIDLNVLKCDGQCPKLIHVLAIFIRLLRYELLLIVTLKCL